MISRPRNGSWCPRWPNARPTPPRPCCGAAWPRLRTNSTPPLRLVNPSAGGSMAMTGDDDLLAADLAAEAGRRLLALRARGGDPDALRRDGDRLSHEFLAAELARPRPRAALPSEAGQGSPERLSGHPVWIVDPLDGTREFVEPGRSDWAVPV